jgi:site-specific DNA-adenine methylase
MDYFMGYPGGKSGAGVYQTIINLIPPHQTYIETHLGGGAVMRHKKPATINIGIDIDPNVINNWYLQKPFKNITLLNTDAIAFLNSYDLNGTEFVYCDPPYMMETRRSGPLYDFEYSDKQHKKLLEIIVKLPCKIMISGYWSELYRDFLSGWFQHTYFATTRSGKKAKEYLWMNYQIHDGLLHDYSFIGKDYRDRERIKKMQTRWINRFKTLPDVERNAILQILLNKFLPVGI